MLTEDSDRFSSTGLREPAVALTRQNMLIAAALALLVLFLGHFRMVPAVCGAYHDDAIYVITAKALAQGQGYKLINLPNTPLQTKYPILYPALLAIVWKLWPVFPDNLLIMKWLTLVCAGLSIGLIYLYLIRFGYFSRRVVLAASLLCVTSPFFLYFSSTTLTEMPFALLAVLALWVVDSQTIQPSESSSRHFFCGVLLALPFLCRTIGASLILSGLLIYYHWKLPVRWLALGVIVVILPWFLWMLAGMGAWNQDPISGYYTDYLSWWYSVGISLISGLVFNNFFGIVFSDTILSFQGLTNFLEAVNLKGLPQIAFLMGLIPLFNILIKIGRWQTLPFFIISYLSIVVIWPWPPMRFIVPILPFIISYMLYGIWSLLNKFSFINKFTSLIIVILCILIAANLTLIHRYHSMTQKTGYPFDMAQPPNSASWSSYQKLFNWLKSRTKPDEVIASWADPMIYLYTGRKAFRPWIISPSPLMRYGENVQSYGTLEEFTRTLKDYGTRYLVKVPNYAVCNAHINELIEDLQERYPGWANLVYVGEDQRFAVYELEISNQPQ